MSLSPFNASNTGFDRPTNDFGNTSSPSHETISWTENNNTFRFPNSHDMASVFREFDTNSDNTDEDPFVSLQVQSGNHIHNQTMFDTNLARTDNPTRHDLPLALDQNQSSAFDFNLAAIDPSPLTASRQRVGCDGEDEPMTVQDIELPTISTMDSPTEEQKKTVLTIDNLDSATRGEILNFLCQRKLTTTIEIV